MGKRGSDERWTQLATRIPKTLHRELKLHSLQAEITVMEFVVKAIEEKLRKLGATRGRKAR